MGKLAHDNEALGSSDTVNDAVVLRQFMFLSGEICLSCAVGFGGKTRQGLRDTKPRHVSVLSTGMSYEPDSNHKLNIAACEVTRWLKLGQKSADTIVAECSV